MRNIIKQTSEYEVQKTFVSWFKLTYPDYIIFSVVNEGIRHNGNKLVDSGLLKGITDLVVVTDKQVIFLEMKKIGGKLSAEQIKVHKKLELLGYKVITGFGFFDAKQKIEEALNDKQTNN